MLFPSLAPPPPPLFIARTSKHRNEIRSILARTERKPQNTSNDGVEIYQNAAWTSPTKYAKIHYKATQQPPPFRPHPLLNTFSTTASIAPRNISSSSLGTNRCATWRTEYSTFNKREVHRPAPICPHTQKTANVYEQRAAATRSGGGATLGFLTPSRRSGPERRAENARKKGRIRTCLARAK